MAILERHVHHIKDAEAYWERERKFKEVEDRIGGFPPKRYYRLLSGTEDMGTMALEREWESFTAMEAAYDKLFAEPAIQDLADSGPAAGNTERLELYDVEQAR